MSSSEEVIEKIQSAVVDIVNDTIDGTLKPKAKPEGMMVAYGSLVLMALIPIFYGSFKSISYHKEQFESGEKIEAMSKKEAALFPFYASGALFGLYLFFKFFSKEHINLLLSVYFLVLGVCSLASVVSDFIDCLLKKRNIQLPHIDKFHLLLTKNSIETLNIEFDSKDIFSLIACSGIGIWYIMKKHWVANNLFGFSFAVKAIEYINLNNVATGCILLGGLFIYDIFWVFGTDVMVTVAKSFDAPIKLIFPQDFLDNGFNGTQFAMLGLGDIVIPGIFIALLLRFDANLNRGRNTYFYSSFIAYIFGLFLTMVVMVYFKHAQPALLYLVPCCISFPMIVALFQGDFLHLLSRFQT
ncbi:Minor histocompatibility antigen H13 [Sarcoptes scabiei]|nr:Minor histocompatibility antigen H13 [Sarcoptes scabiei]